jgi:23S rRNA (uracil1939-C5)-methyltransferase
VRLTIEKLIYGGDGLARLPAAGDARKGKVVFVPYALPGETVEARIAEERRGFLRAELVEVLEPSPERIAPPCPHFGVCGGCQYQYLGYAAQAEAKRQILRETLLRGAGAALRESGLELPQIELHAAEEFGYRNRTRMKIVVEPEFAMGYRRTGSHELESVRECPISSPLINRAIAAMWEMGTDAAACTGLQEVQFFANHDDGALLVEVRTQPEAASAKSTADALRGFARHLRERLPEIAGVAVFAGAAAEDELEQTPVRASAHAEPFLVEGAASLEYCTAGECYRVSAGSFFQTNRFLAGKLVELVTRDRSGKAALDLYAGVGLFALPLARGFEKVTAVEIGASSSGDLAANAAAVSGAGRIRTVHSTTENFLRSSRGRWDFAVADPPRAGLGTRVAKQLAGMKIPRLAIVSCDPATLARDLAILVAGGYRVEEAHLVDLFPQSYHMETVLHLVR